MADNATPSLEGNDPQSAMAATIVMEAIQLSSNVAEALGEAGVSFRNAMGWDAQGNQGIDPEQVTRHLPKYEKQVGELMETVTRLSETLPTADQIAFTSVKENIPADLTVVQALEGNLVPTNEVVDAIADWFHAIDDDLDVLYAESLFGQALLFQEGIDAPETAALNERIGALLESVGPGRESLGHVLSYFE